jgi:DNA-binding NarL/FixJ family response regulator
MNKPIRVVVADDHALGLAGLHSLLVDCEDIHLIATATDGERLLETVRRFQPDLVLTDLRMSCIAGQICLARLRQAAPATRILLIAACDDPATIRSIMAAGPEGLLFKSDPPDQVITAIRQVMADQLVFPAAARAWLHAPTCVEPAVQVSHRELEILALVAEGMSNAEITLRLHISPNTVKFHLQNIYHRLGVNSRTEASRWYLRNYEGASS